MQSHIHLNPSLPPPPPLPPLSSISSPSFLPSLSLQLPLGWLLMIQEYSLPKNPLPSDTPRPLSSLLQGRESSTSLSSGWLTALTTPLTTLSPSLCCRSVRCGDHNGVLLPHLLSTTYLHEIGSFYNYLINMCGPTLVYSIAGSLLMLQIDCREGKRSCKRNRVVEISASALSACE